MFFNIKLLIQLKKDAFLLPSKDPCLSRYLKVVRRDSMESIKILKI